MRFRIETDKVAGPLPCMGRTAFPAERIARNMCKALSDKFVMDRSDLRHATYREILADRRKGGPWSIAYPSNKDFDSALSFAVIHGWLSERGEFIELTPAGADVAYRLRIGRRR